MTTSTAMPALFVDYARNAGIVDDKAIAELFAMMRQQSNVTPQAESLTCESKRSADEVFGPEEVIKPKKAAKAPSQYRALQAQCKVYGLKANGSTSILQDRIRAHETDTASVDMYAKVKSAKTRGPAKIKESCFGLTYRQTQRLVKWCKDNMPSNLLPADMAKNTGWANVKHNAERCLTAHGWCAKLADRHIQQLCDYCGIIDPAQLETFLTESGLA